MKLGKKAIAPVIFLILGGVVLLFVLLGVSRDPVIKYTLFIFLGLVFLRMVTK